MTNAKKCESVEDKAKKTILKHISCEGYVKKKGHRVKSWKRRYLVFDGETKSIAYYDSKSAYQRHDKAKKQFSVSNVERQEYKVGTINKQILPYGFKITGNRDRKGYFELHVSLDNSKDQARWIQVIKNGLKGLQASDVTLDMRKEALIGIKPPKSPAQLKQSLDGEVDQISGLHESRDMLLLHALTDIEASNKLGNATNSELNHQNEELDTIDDDLNEINHVLDHGQHLLNEMKHPMHHLFGSKEKDNKGKVGQRHKANNEIKSTGKIANSNQSTDSSNENDILSRLNVALDGLELQSKGLSDEIDYSTEKIDVIGEKLTSVNERVKTQTSCADQISKKGNLF